MTTYEISTLFVFDLLIFQSTLVTIVLEKVSTYST